MAAIDQHFYKGLDKDTELDLQPADSYRDMRNMILISSDGSRFAAESVEGNTQSFQLSDQDFKIIGWAGFIDKLVVFSTNSVAGGEGEIGIVTFNGTVGTYRPIYRSPDLNFSREHPIFEDGQVANPETPAKDVVYWTDNFNPPRALNTSDLGHVVSGNIEDGVIYQVAKGPITYNGVLYTTGQTFTGVAGVTTYASIIPDPSIVVHIPINQLNWVPETTTPTCKFFKTVTGDLFCGMYQIAIQLENKATGAKTTWSPLSFPVHVGPSPTILGAAPSIKDYGRYEGNFDTVPSQKGIIFDIENIDTTFDFIRVTYVQVIGLAAPLTSTIFFEGGITGDKMQVTLRGDENLGTVTFDELVQAITNTRRVKTIATNKNRLFAGNISTTEDFEYDTSGITVTPFTYSLPSDTQGNPGTTGQSVGGGDPDPIAGHIAQAAGGVSSITAGGHYVVRGTGQINYNGTVYSAGQDFAAVTGVGTFTVVSGTPVVRAAVRIQKFTGVYDIIDLNDQFWDNQGMVYDKHVKSYMRKEVYRIGIMPYDPVGNPMFVRHVADIEIPAQGDPGFALVEQIGVETLIKNVALKLSNIDVTAIADKISGFSIVRARRDPQIIAQGLWWPTVGESGAPRFIHPASSPILDADEYHRSSGGRQQQAYLFHSPEWLFEFDGQPNELEGDYFRIEDYYDTLRGVGGFPDQQDRHVGEEETQNHHYYQKFVRPVAPPTGASPKGDTNRRQIGNRGGEITFGDDNAGAGVDVGLGPDLLFKNTAQMVNDGNWKAGFRAGRGMKTHLVLTQNGETATSGFGNVNKNRSAKALVSYVRPNNNLYGGTTDSAKANTQYIFCGHYQPINDQVFAQNGNSWIFNDVEVFGGDVYVNIFDVGRVVKDNYAEDIDNITQFSHGVIFPVESRVNTGLRLGRHLNKERSWEKQGSAFYNLDGLAFTTDDPANSQPEEFAPGIYNEAYSYDELLVTYPALPLDHNFNNDKPNQVIYSEIKFSGEVIDNWRRFLINNEKEVETRSGEINNLRVKQGRLFYWQNRGLGYIPVQERVQISDALGNPTSLGEGGVATRFDESTNYYGNQHQGSMTETPEGFTWFDMRNRAFMFMSAGGGMAELSVLPQKGLHSFFHNQLQGDVISNDVPTMGRGIVATYDPRFKHVLMSFMGVGAGTGNRTEDFTLAWSDAHKQFVGFFDFIPSHMFRFNERYVSAPIALGDLPGDVIQGGTNYLIGDLVADNDTVYVAITNFTTPATPVAPSLDPTNWAKAYDNRSAWTHNDGQICRFYGVVHDNLITAIANAGGEVDKRYDNFMFNGPSNDPFFTEIICRNTGQQGQDSDIDVDTNPEYEYRNHKVYSNVPFDNNDARFVDHYLEVEMRRDNKLNDDPTTSSDKKIKIVSLRTIFDQAF